MLPIDVILLLGTSNWSRTVTVCWQLILKYTVTLYWQLKSYCYSVRETNVILLQFPGNWPHTLTIYCNWRHTLSFYWQLTSYCYIVLATNIIMLQCTVNWCHIFTVYWQMTSYCSSYLQILHCYNLLATNVTVTVYCRLTSCCHSFLQQTSLCYVVLWRDFTLLQYTRKWRCIVTLLATDVTLL